MGKRKELVINEPVLEGRHIYLEGLSAKHVSSEYANWLNDQEVCRENRHGQIHNTLKMTRAYVESVDKSSTQAVFAIMTKPGKAHVGNISLGNISWGNNSGEISILIGNKPYWGKGIATQAYSLVIGYGFKKLGLHRLYSGMTLTNKAMIRVSEKVGMKKEGIFKESLHKSGIYKDIVQYAIINRNQKNSSCGR